MAKENLTLSIEKAIKSVSEISRMCSDEMIDRSSNTFLACDLHNDYMIWKTNTTQTLYGFGLILDAKIFGMESLVPYVKSGIDYGDKNSKKSRNLIKEIAVEIKEKVKQLQDISQREVSELKKLDAKKNDYSSSDKKEKTGPIPSIKIEDGFLICGLHKMPTESGQKSMAILFLANAKIYHGSKGRLIKKGNGIRVENLKEVGGYKSEGSFRDALRLFRSKLKNSSIPAKIETISKGKYQMVITYTIEHNVSSRINSRIKT